MRLIQQLQEDDKRTIFKLIDKMLNNKKFKDFLAKNVVLYKYIIMEYIINILLWLFKPKDLVRLSFWLHDSRTGKKSLKIAVTALFFSLNYISFLVAEFRWLKSGLTLKGLHISSAVFMALISLTSLYFYFTFKDLFFPKKNNKNKPFTIV